MNNNDLTEYADYLLQMAMYKVQNIEDAEDLVQETLVAGLVAINQGQCIDNPKSWLVTVLYRKFYDMLRRKYRKGTVSIYAVGEILTQNDITEKIEQSEEAENIRHCLANLTDIYRKVMVRYYMHGESVKQIAADLNIPENTVKSRLDTGRKHIRKDFTMENYTKQSYEPETLNISISGRESMDNEPFSLVDGNKIEMNLLILAYKKPVTIPELAGAIGIPTAYIEPIVEKLVKGELMKRVQDKVYTDFIIFDEQDRTANLPLERSLADKHYKEVWEIMSRGLDELHEQDYYKRQTASAQEKLDSYFAVRTMLHAISGLKISKTGEWHFKDFADRPNGGKWHAMGFRYPADYDWAGTHWYKEYYIDGEYDACFSDYEGLNELELRSYDTTLLSKTHSHGWNSTSYVSHPMEITTLTKMLHAIYAGKENLLPVIDAHCFDNIEGLIRLGILTRDANSNVKIDIPVITTSEKWELYKLSDRYDNEITEKFSDKFGVLLDNPVKLPPHLKSVPDWQRYMHCTSCIAMMIVMNAHENGLFFAGRNLEQNPVPAMFMAIAE